MKSFLRKNTKILALFGLLLFLLVPDLAWAQDTNSVQKVVWYIVSGVFGFFLGIAGLILNAGIDLFVIDFGKLYASDGIGIAVEAAWLNFRDIFNISFIFGLVYIGFKMILDSADSSTKRWLIHLIMAAVLVNFSLYITKFVIDVSNTLASEIAISGFDPIPAGRTFAGYPSVSETFMDAVGISSALGKSDEIRSETGLNLISEDGGWGYIFGTMILFIIATFVFAAGGLLLIIRGVVLLIYIMLSPAMFLGWVFPQLQKHTDEFWRGFLGNAFFAPLYILLLYLSASVIETYRVNIAGGRDPDFAGALGGSGQYVEQSFISTFMPFIVGSILLVASIIISKKLGAKGGDVAVDSGRKLTNYSKRKLRQGSAATARLAAAPVVIPAAMTARYASNRAGNMVNRKLEKWQEAGGVRAKIAGSAGVSDATTNFATNLKNNKFGLKNTVDQVTQKEGAIASRVTSKEDIKRGHADGAELASGTINSTTGQVWDSNRQVQGSSKMGSYVDRNTLTPDQIKVLLEQNAAKGKQEENSLTQKELEMMLTNDKATFDKVVGGINADSFDKLMGSDNLNPAQKSDMLSKRQAAIRNTFEQGGVILTENLQKMSIKQIETMGDQFIRSNASLFSQEQINDIKKSNKYTEDQKNSYIAQRKTALVNLATRGTGQSQLFNHNTASNTGTYDKRKKAAEIASLPFEVFINPSTGIPYMNNVSEVDASVLEEIFKKGTMTADQRNQLKTAIESIKTGQTAATTSAQNYLSSTQGTRNWA